MYLLPCKMEMCIRSHPRGRCAISVMLEFHVHSRACANLRFVQRELCSSTSPSPFPSRTGEFSALRCHLMRADSVPFVTCRPFLPAAPLPGMCASACVCRVVVLLFPGFCCDLCFGNLGCVRGMRGRGRAGKRQRRVSQKKDRRTEGGMGSDGGGNGGREGGTSYVCRVA